VVHGTLCGLGGPWCGSRGIGSPAGRTGCAENNQSLLTMLMGTSAWGELNNLPEASGRDASAVDSDLHGPCLPERMGIREHQLLASSGGSAFGSPDPLPPKRLGCPAVVIFVGSSPSRSRTRSGRAAVEIVQAASLLASAT
jgi:hypothetical protein